MALKAHCQYCFDVIAWHLGEREEPAAPLFENIIAPLFVTFKTVANGRKSLRGCIGTFTPQSLHDGLKDYALQSAVQFN
jgi:AMMECR1 domain-containing protein